MYIKFDRNKFNELVEEIKLTCESKKYAVPCLLKNHDVCEEYIFPDYEGE